MLTTHVVLTGGDLTAARQVARWGVLEVAAMFLVDDHDPRFVTLIAERERIRRSLGDDYDREDPLTAEQSLHLARVAADCLVEGAEIIADGGGANRPDLAEHYRAQQRTARRVLDALTGAR